MRVSNEERLAVVNTMIQQMGGQRVLVMMIGAKNFVHSVDEEGNVFLTFKHMKGLQGINCNRITLKGDDTYTVQYMKTHGTSCKTIEERSMMFFDDLVPFFREVTGLEIIVPRIVGINS